MAQCRGYELLTLPKYLPAVKNHCIDTPVLFSKFCIRYRCVAAVFVIFDEKKIINNILNLRR